MAALTLWIAAEGSAPSPRVPAGPVWLSPSGFLSEGLPPSRAREALVIVPAETGAGASAALLVPDALGRKAALNGTCLVPGMHLLRHGDQVAFAGFEVWASLDAAPVETAYDPAAHGAEAFCARTKRRLKEGEPIVVCPGPPGRACGLRYSQAAWASGLRCHGCQLDPRARRWEPPSRAPRGFRWTPEGSARARAV